MIGKPTKDKLLEALVKDNFSDETRNDCQGVLKKYLSRTYSKDDSELITQHFKSAETKKLLEATCKNGKLDETLQNASITATFNSITVPTSNNIQAEVLLLFGSKNEPTPEQPKSKRQKMEENKKSTSKEEKNETKQKEVTNTTSDKTKTLRDKYATPRETNLRLNPIIATSGCNKDTILDNIVEHVKNTYEDYNEENIRKRLKKKTPEELADIISDTNSLNELILSTSCGPIKDQYGTDGNHSNTVEAYQVEIIKTNSKTSSGDIVRSAYKKLQHQATSRRHTAVIVSKDGAELNIITPEEYPRSASKLRKYQDESTTSVTVTILSSMNLVRFFDENDPYCEAGCKRLKSESLKVKIREVTRPDAVKTFHIFQSHTDDNIQRIARELRDACQHNNKAEYNTSAVSFQLDEVSEIEV